jgi:hypothetical protein
MQVLMWMNQSFLLEHPLDNSLNESFTCIRDGKMLKMQMKNDGQVWHHRKST